MAVQLFILLTPFNTVYTVYTLPTASHCLNSSMYAYIYYQGRLKRYRNGLMGFCKILGDGWMDGLGG